MWGGYAVLKQVSLAGWRAGGHAAGLCMGLPILRKAIYTEEGPSVDGARTAEIYMRISMHCLHDRVQESVRSCSCEAAQKNPGTAVLSFDCQGAAL